MYFRIHAWLSGRFYRESFEEVLFSNEKFSLRMEVNLPHSTSIWRFHVFTVRVCSNQVYSKFTWGLHHPNLWLNSSKGIHAVREAKLSFSLTFTSVFKPTKKVHPWWELPVTTEKCKYYVKNEGSKIKSYLLLRRFHIYWVHRFLISIWRYV